MEFGIDLGTTQSCIAYVDDTGRPVVVKSALGEDTTPSAVFFESPRHAVVGRAAHDEALLTPHLVAQLVKREMGTGASYTFHGERHTPESVSALILRELAQVAARQLGEPASEVVITVPAYFGIAERAATRRAGELAGLTVLDVLAEPVAAGICHTATSGPVAAPRAVLVYDLGGGTFDTTVLRLEGDDVTVACTDGDSHLGGADWDQAVADALLARFTEEHPGLHPEGDPQFMQDLLIAVERLKRELSSVESRRHVLRFGGRTTVVQLTRAEVEELTRGLLARTVDVLDRTMATARAKGVAGVDEVLLVGGMSRFPAVTRVLRERLGVDARLHEPELAVAKGAALYARALRERAAGSGAGAEDRGRAGIGPATPDVRRLAAARVADVVPRAFGVIGLDGRDPLALSDPVRARKMIVHLLLANTELPVDTGPYTFLTSIDNQRMVGIEVWEQAGPELSEDLADNRKVGEGMLRNLPPGLPSGSRVEVTFFMSETGRLTVHAKEPASGRDVQFDLQIGGFDNSRLNQAKRSVAGYDVDG
jgi:molecular chaperone DnaK